MTIVATVKVRDGLVLATDSMTQVQSEGQWLKAYENAHKLFQVGDRPVGAMTYGLGNIGNRSIESLMLEFRTQIGNRKAVTSLTDALFDFIKACYDAQFAETPADERPELGFIVAGYSPNQPFAEEREFLLPRDKQPQEVRGPEDWGAAWRGIEWPFSRLYKGIDPRLYERLKARGLSDADIEADIADLETPVMYAGMPVQDAINFTKYILTATIGYATFSVGVPACGGPLQVATILPDDGFSWISKPEYSC
jgi:hypothetical protein